MVRNLVSLILREECTLRAIEAEYLDPRGMMCRRPEKKILNKELHNSHSLSKIMRKIKLRMRRKKHVARKEHKCIQRFGIKT
jgi:hypothetical protein